MGPHLNADIKERICQAVHVLDAQHAPDHAHPLPRHFATSCMALTHTNSSWRHIAYRYAWRTLYIDDMLSSSITSIRIARGTHTRKLWIHVQFHTLAIHYRRYASTHENTRVQPFCDIALWPHLDDVEIVYAHKCAFPGLAAYLEPRLGRVRRLTVSGRVPIDMRRSIVLLQSRWIEEIHFCALPREDDSLSSISSHNDPVLNLSLAPSVSALTITTLVDIRIVRSVLAKARAQLKRLELIGMSSEQLATIGVFCQYNAQSAHAWTQLCVLTVRMAVDYNESLVCVRLDAAEFPRLEALAIVDNPGSKAVVPEYPTRISYEKSFAKQWPRLSRLRLQALSNDDTWAIARFVPQLSTLRVCSDLYLCSESMPSATGLWHLLATAAPLQAVSINCVNAQCVHEESDSSKLDFGQLGKNQYVRSISAPHMVLSSNQVMSIRQACLNLTTFNAGSGIISLKSETSRALWFISAPSQSFARLVNKWLLE
ncbi:hypothetical protein GGH12_003593 [Coemansia sp. RSA 1822]|nr:hypothetical protein GGF49_002055 [Coemansia sp. RSA 1853]KAJ2561967.1 hypothetical protein GGH12_003593 [Coemansia sp. RSA 1822]